MPKDDPESRNPDNSTNDTASKATSGSQRRSEGNSRTIFKLPQPLKQIFDQFPLKTYPPNDLPRRARGSKQGQNTLYIFTTVEGARDNRPSFNPGCLKWQTYLRINGIKHVVFPSNNHASPTGALPFLLPGSASSPIPANKIPKWASIQSPEDNAPRNPREDAYLSLLSHRIRPAWLHALYLTPSNSSDVAHRLYIGPSTSSSIVQSVLSSQLQSAALEEILKLSPSLTQTTLTSSEIDNLYTEARLAFSALSTLLGDDEWFLGQEQAGLFDASVFAYTYLILDPDKIMRWRDQRLTHLLGAFKNLEEHCTRISERHFRQ